MNWNDCKNVARGFGLRNIHLQGICNNRTQFLHGSEEYKRCFDEECGKIGQTIFHKNASPCYYPDQYESCFMDTASSFERQDSCIQVLLKSENSLKHLTSVPLNVKFVEGREKINNVNVPCNTGHNNGTTKLSTSISSETNQGFTEENVNFFSSGMDITKNCSDVKMKYNSKKTKSRKQCPKTFTSKTLSSYGESTSSKSFVGEHDYKGIKRKHDATRADEKDMYAKGCVSPQPAAKANKHTKVVCDSDQDLKQCTRDCVTMARFVNVRTAEAISTNKDSDNKECTFPQCYYNNASNVQHDTVACHQRIYHPVLHPNYPDETKHTTKNITCTNGMEGELKVFPTCMEAFVQAKEENNMFKRQHFPNLSSEANYYVMNETPSLSSSRRRSYLNNRDEKIQNLKELLAQQEETLEKLRGSRVFAKKTMDKNAISSWLKNNETDGYHGSSDLEALPKNGAKNVLGVKKSWLKAWNQENNIVTKDENKSRQ